MNNITRVCRKCGQEKPLSEFARDKSCALGYRHTCKQCHREQCRKYYAANAEKVREQRRKYSAANPEKVRKWKRKWYAANAKKELERQRKWRAVNPEKVRERQRKWCEILSNWYLRNQLKQRNLPITPEMIDYKRIQLKLYREIKNQQNDERD